MYAYQAVYLLIVNLFLSADTQIQRKLLYLSVCGFLFLETASFFINSIPYSYFGVIKKRKENINNGKTEITKQVLKVRRGFLEITRKVSCMPRMFCIKKKMSLEK